MLTIRLSRVGKKNKPMYRLVISEKTRDPYGRALEILGSYNPYTKDLQVKADRIKHWLSVGAGMSDTVNNLLVGNDVVKGEKVKASKPGKKKKEVEEESKTAPVEGTGTEKEKKESVEVEEKPAEEVKNEETTPKEEIKDEESDVVEESKETDKEQNNTEDTENKEEKLDKEEKKTTEA